MSTTTVQYVVQRKRRAPDLIAQRGEWVDEVVYTTRERAEADLASAREDDPLRTYRLVIRTIVVTEHVTEQPVSP